MVTAATRGQTKPGLPPNTHTHTHVEILTFTHNNAPRDCLSPLQQTVTLIYLLRCTYAFTRETERDTFSKR